MKPCYVTSYNHEDFLLLENDAAPLDEGLLNEAASYPKRAGSSATSL